ncbi:uncharacterized protein LOC120423313 [Culex pipiens pallens]|uniref:uncharacterized protein LOC120423313 n=1 Tax=Culex pipiens pallens TaxID=42434 RepID=UPI001952D6B1|nr:uncharacterized protein LOC120423313 [Culex pipiens pallens]
MIDSNLNQTVCGACGIDFIGAEEITAYSKCVEMYHSRCVYSTAADTKWCCPEGCLQRNVDARVKDDRDRRLNRSSETVSKQPVAVTESDMPEIAQTAPEDFDADRWIRQKQIEIELELAERQAQIDRELREKEEKMAEAIRMMMRRQGANLELERKRKADHERRMEDLERSFRRRSSLIDERLEKIWFSCEKPLPSAAMEETAVSDEKVERDEGSSDTDEDGDESAINRAKDAIESSTKLGKTFVSRSPNGLGQQRSGLKKARLAAGRGFTRQSPCYPNDPEEWQKSLGTREGSSRAYGVTDERKLAELPDWLKCVARDTGRSLVDCVELQHAESARGHAHPKADQRASLTSLETARYQVCEHMEATDHTHHLVYLLAQDPVSELPNREERHRADIKRKTEAKANPSRIIPETISGTSRRRRQVEAVDFYCRKSDSSSPNSVIKKQQNVCLDHKLRFCEEVNELSDKSTKIRVVKSWGATLRPVSGDVQKKLGLQRTAEAHRAWRRITRTSEWTVAVDKTDGETRLMKPERSVQNASGILAVDGWLNLVTIRCDLRWMLLAQNQQHEEAVVKDPDKPTKHNPLQVSETSLPLMTHLCSPTLTSARSSWTWKRTRHVAALGLHNLGRKLLDSSETGCTPKSRVTQAENEDIPEQQHKWRGRREEDEAVLKVDGKSDKPQGPTDVTGWGVTTAEMATLPTGAAVAV